MNRKLFSATVLLPLLAACAAPSVLLAGTNPVILDIQPQVRSGGFSTQAVVSPYAQSDINHMEIKVFTVASSTETPLLASNGNPVYFDIPAASLSAKVSLTQLHMNTTYRIRAYAYSSAGTGSLISTTDSGSYVDVVVTNNDRPALATLPVQLINQTFSGAATASSFAVSTGSIIHAGTESIVLN